MKTAISAIAAAIATLFLSHASVCAEASRTATLTTDGCALAPKPPAERDKFFEDLIARYGGADFAMPPEVRPTTREDAYKLEVRYGDNSLAGCLVHLRSYNGKLVGDTIRAKPGDTLYIKVVNQLPPSENIHPQVPPPTDHAKHFSFNITNLHTHGLHTAPQGTPHAEGDNVMLEIPPGRSQYYKIRIPKDHPEGTFWYHAHVHGATAIQVSSGMAGALIIEGGEYDHGGLETIPSIARAKEKVFVLQQFTYGDDGKIENFDQPALTRHWLSRGVIVNGQLVPVIRMHPGEIQRWRFIHAGVQDNIELSIDGLDFYEIADDGVTLGRLVKWPSIQKIDGERYPILGPGYRMDLLVKARPLDPGETRHEYFVRDLALGSTKSITAASAALDLSKQRVSAAAILDATLQKPEFLIARVVVEGEPVSMSLPSDSELQDRVPSALPPITADELKVHPDPNGIENVALQVKSMVCDSKGNCLSDNCESDTGPADPGCADHFAINYKVYMPERPGIRVPLGSASTWVLKGTLMTHPFHIHVNPFQVERLEPGPDGKPITKTIWKDTLLLPGDETPVTIRSRYTDFKGKFVLHCHILGHEDQGMMENVEIY